MEGCSGDIVDYARKFAANGFDAALITAGGEATDRALTYMRDGGRVAHPLGLQPAVKARSNVRLYSYDLGKGFPA